MKTEHRADTNCYGLLTALCALIWVRFDSSSVPQVRCQNANWAVDGHLTLHCLLSLMNRWQFNISWTLKFGTPTVRDHPFLFQCFDFRDWFRRIGIRQRGWQIWFPRTPVPLCYCTDHSRLSQGLSFINKSWLLSGVHRAFLKSITF